MTKPDALMLANQLQQQAVWEGHYGPSVLRDLLPVAAAELRRLHDENEALRLYEQAMAATPAAPQRADDADRLLREVFALCEATEDAPEELGGGEECGK